MEGVFEARFHFLPACLALQLDMWAGPIVSMHGDASDAQSQSDVAPQTGILLMLCLMYRLLGVMADGL